MVVLLFVVAAGAAVRGLWSPCGLSMLSALNPVAERARGHRFAFTAAWYVAGATLGGALLGAGCAAGASLVGWLHAPVTARWVVVLIGAVIAAASDARLGGWSLPIHPRQVDERWLTAYRRWCYAVGFGVQIGCGIATYVMTAGVYLTALVAIAGASPAAALAGGVTFGLIRGLGLLVAAPARDPQRLAAVMRRVESYEPASRTLGYLACVAGASAAGWRLGSAPLAGVMALAGLFVWIGNNRLGRGDIRRTGEVQSPWLSAARRSLLVAARGRTAHGGGDR